MSTSPMLRAAFQPTTYFVLGIICMVWGGAFSSTFDSQAIPSREEKWVSRPGDPFLSQIAKDSVHASVVPEDVESSSGRGIAGAGSVTSRLGGHVEAKLSLGERQSQISESPQGTGNLARKNGPLLEPGQCQGHCECLEKETWNPCAVVSFRQKSLVVVKLPKERSGPLAALTIGLHSCATSRCMVSETPNEPANVFLESKVAQNVAGLAEWQVKGLIGDNFSIELTPSRQGNPQQAWRYPAKVAGISCKVCEEYSRQYGDINPMQMEMPTLFHLPQCANDTLGKPRLDPPFPALDVRLGIEAMYVVHYTKLKHRKKDMMTRMHAAFNASPVFIDLFDKEALQEDELKCLVDQDKALKFINRKTYLGENSGTIKHMAAYYHMFRYGIQNAFIMEDDATVTVPDWYSNKSMWQVILRDLPADYDMVMLSPFSDTSKRGKRINQHLNLVQESRVAILYLVSQKGARNMLRTLPVIAPADFQINYMGGQGDTTGKNRLPKANPGAINCKIFHSQPPMGGEHDSTGVDGLARS
mmetsp:Transcript_26709/g.67390  ORF Transcript_26709/g.67390 Transcript_26709/m.67390 type:complete len:529 (+) Transcript_26709:204-1790(+)|eukprot:CAMPEP_0173435828 /NCGR_PEP_ID=MMETSP1357-20121228/15612_1 /TAXON_ID=77926 /ORGANISM="Hemiselmis rufescens, Strain PCC563" /LENGTH=528 /DNA_ID=CAMNT_0014400857 /DNA_START=200 /DNA_END=1786 /DNA_ORIENTATION=-